jgi:hypothetical protein
LILILESRNGLPDGNTNHNFPLPKRDGMRKENLMSLDRMVMAFAGFMVLFSLALTLWVSSYFVWLTVFVGINQIQSAFTGFCPAATAFKWLGVKPGTAF